MDFTLPARMPPLLARMRAFVDERVIPLEPTFLQAGFRAVEAELDARRVEVRELGLWAPQLPTELDGLGLSLVEHGLVSEVLGRSPLGHYVFGCQAPDAGNLEILHRHGTPEQRARWLEPLARGAIRSCFAMTEPDQPGSNPTELACRAYDDGSDWVIDGRKWFTTGADGAAFAIVMAVTDPDAPAHRRASMLIVPTDTPGYRRVRNISIMGRHGEGHDSHAEVVFEGCRVPDSQRLGPRGGGFAVAQERLGPGRIHHCMRWIGICERSFELMVARAVTRRMGGGSRGLGGSQVIDETLSRKQIVQAWIAESRARINAARLLVLDAAWRIDAAAHAGGFHAAQEEISLIKFHVAEVMLEVVDRAIQVHGAMGITDDTVLAWFYSQERGARIYDGPDEVHKLAAARRILKRLGPVG